MIKDIFWAIAMFRAKRYRNTLRFSARSRFDDCLRPLTHSQCILAYPDAFYNAENNDVSRAITTCELLIDSEDREGK